MFLKGMLVCGSLIIAIGAQNAFVIKQGLLKNNIFWVALICFICDASLMAISISGVGAIINDSPLIMALVSIGGALFLITYGIRSLISAFKSTGALELSTERSTVSLKKTIIMTLAVTLLNPHVYLDTVVIVGGVASVLPADEKIFFFLGAVLVSFIWFFGIAYGARLLFPLFKTPKFWRLLDAVIGLIMLWIASGLLFYTYNQ